MRGIKVKRAPRHTAAEWTEIVERFERSGLAIPAFATQEGLGAKRLRIWRARLQRRGTGARGGAPHRQRPSATSRRQQAGSASMPFLPLRLHSNSGADTVEMVLVAGTTVRVTGSLAQQLLGQLLARL